jgi:hypothetical protein
MLVLAEESIKQKESYLLKDSSLFGCRKEKFMRQF